MQRAVSCRQRAREHLGMRLEFWRADQKFGVAERVPAAALAGWLHAVQPVSWQ